jgi:hypothetical protein
MFSSGVDPDTGTELFARVGYEIIVPDPVMTFLTGNSVRSLQLLLQNCPKGLPITNRFP